MTPVIVRFIKKKLDIAKLRDSEHILPAPWPFVKSRLFHCGEIKYLVYGKSKIQDEIFSKCMSNKEIKVLKTILMYRIGVYLPIFFVVVTMNCKRQVNGKLGSRSTNSLLYTVCRKCDISVIKVCHIGAPKCFGHFAVLSRIISWNSLGDNFCPIFLHNLVQCNLWDTSIQAGTPSFRGHKIWSRQNLHIIFVFVTSFERTPLFRGKGHFFWAPKPQGLTSIHGSP